MVVLVVVVVMLLMMMMLVAILYYYFAIDWLQVCMHIYVCFLLPEGDLSLFPYNQNPHKNLHHPMMPPCRFYRVRATVNTGQVVCFPVFRA